MVAKNIDFIADTEPEAKAEAGLKAVQEAFDEYLNGNKQVCPHCGRCPACGRGGDRPYDPPTEPYYPPWYPPYDWTYRPYLVTWTTSAT